MYFCDNYKKLNMRKSRLGLRTIMNQLFKKGYYYKNRYLLNNFDEYVMKMNDKIVL